LTGRFSGNVDVFSGLIPYLYLIIYLKMQKDQRLSRLRQALDSCLEELDALLDVFKDQRTEMVKGTVYVLRRRCGKPTCACATGELHASRVLTWSEEGRSRILSIPAERVEELKERTRRYQRFRKARARLVKLHAKMLDIIDRIEEARRLRP
jgi:hypothetical protein